LTSRFRFSSQHLREKEIQLTYLPEEITMSPASYKETMTSKERTIAALTGKPYDRIPVNLLISDHAARVIGVSVGDYNNSAQLLRRLAQLRL
jgi:hypothetical protein